MNKVRSVISATGSCLPENVVDNAEFLDHIFLKKDGTAIAGGNAENIGKFGLITGIQQRRYASDGETASDLGFHAALDALTSSDIDPETIDQIIVAHNFGDVQHGSNRVNMVPSLASRIKNKLQIKNPSCLAYDIIFGCPGWLQGVIQADYYLKAGDAKRCLVIGTETLSRIVDVHDRDSMIYADGAGAIILEATDQVPQGILAHASESHTLDHTLLLAMEPSFDASADQKDLFLKMNGRGVYEFALERLPVLVKKVLDKAGLALSDVQKVLLHQANGKMNNAILDRLFKLYDLAAIPERIMPMTIAFLGNSSVASIPTLLDQLMKNKLGENNISPGDKVVFASVGAGMNINAILYQF